MSETAATYESKIDGPDTTPELPEDPAAAAYMAVDDAALEEPTGHMPPESAAEPFTDPA